MATREDLSRFPTAWALRCYALAAALLAAVAGAAILTGTAPSRFTRDPAVILDADPLLGLVSHAGVLVWAATAAIVLFTALVLRARAAAVDARRWRFLLWAGILSGWLLLDDLFLFHEWLFPVVLGVRTRFLFAAYIALTGLFLFRFAAVIRQTAYPLLGVALAGFALSVGLDVLPDAWFRRNDWLYFIEDTAKLFGIVGWFAYFVHVSRASLNARTAPAGDMRQVMTIST